MMKSLRYVDRKQSTLKDPKQVKKQLSRLAKAWGMNIKECIEYMLRMGLNRCLALERHNRLKAKAAKTKKLPKKSAKKRAKPRGLEVPMSSGTVKAVHDAARGGSNE